MENILRQVYSNESVFGGIVETYKEAKKIFNTITLNDVKEFLEKQKTRQLKGYKGLIVMLLTTHYRKYKLISQYLLTPQMRTKDLNTVL